MRNIIVAATLLAAMSTSAGAETVADTVSKWGLIGVWSVSCQAAAGKDLAGKLQYEARPDGSVYHYRNFGSSKDADKVKSARVTKEGWLELKIFFNSIAAGEQDRTFALKKIAPGVIQAMYNHNAKGVYGVKDGKFTSNGHDTPLQRKCS
jgi:hypothetical protein